ncbi:MAG: hypothetical protein ABEI52_05980 [Halobacteriaceae archaeon]
MSPSEQRPPVHESLTVLESEDIYHNDEWWKAVVRYQFKNSNSDEVAVFLWNHDGDGWARKNKYVVKTGEAWETDKTVVNHLWTESPDPVSDSEFPVSDYYSLAAGETIFQSDGWWKAIVKLDQKGSYETEEVIIYLWQKQDGDWRRRQKYTIKDPESWQEEAEIIESVLTETATTIDQSKASPTSEKSTTNGASTTSTSTKGEISGETDIAEFEELSRELDDHLSEHST